MHLIKKQFGIDLEDHLEIIVIGIVLVTTAPVLIKLFFGKKKKVMMNHILINKPASIFNIAVIVAALGYFVDIYDLCCLPL